MANLLLRRSAAHARELLLPRHLNISVPARQHHLAASASTSTRSYAAGNTSSPYEYDQAQLNTPMNWGLVRVPEGQAFVVERFGKYSKTLNPGWRALIPLVDRIAYVHSFKEQVIPIGRHKSITNEGFTLDINNSVVHFQVAVNDLTTKWGIKVLRYDIGDVPLPSLFMQSLELEVEAIKEKLAQKSLSEGDVSLPSLFMPSLEVEATKEKLAQKSLSEVLKRNST